MTPAGNHFLHKSLPDRGAVPVAVTELTRMPSAPSTVNGHTSGQGTATQVSAAAGTNIRPAFVRQYRIDLDLTAHPL
jgi:hypothetical protein